MSSIFPTACTCTAPGWCPRHKCEKDRVLFEYCRRLESWFQLWERGEAPTLVPPLGRGGSLGVPTEPRHHCRHIGPEVRRQHCPTCEGHVEIKIFACAVHRECALSLKVNDVACCQACADFKARDVEPSH